MIWHDTSCYSLHSIGSVLRSPTARRGPESRDVRLLRHSQSADIPGRPACQQRGRGQPPLHLRLYPRLLLRHGLQPLVGPPHLHLVSLRRYLKFQLSYFQGCGSGSYPDPDWIRIQSGQRIRIRNPDPDPYPGGQKIPTKVEKNLKISCFEVLDGLF